jgi:hypothetical protein
MGEKKGQTAKLVYDFNTAGLLEVSIKGTWFRTSAREFRSFDGLRRITQPQETLIGRVDVPMITYDYKGPVYMFGSNLEVPYSSTETIISSTFWEQARKNTETRGI